jgi:hypothetical protein
MYLSLFLFYFSISPIYLDFSLNPVKILKIFLHFLKKKAKINNNKKKAKTKTKQKVQTLVFL